MTNKANQDWVDVRIDPFSQIETIRAHFTGHAYDPHFHDAYLIGVTEQGIQQFHCDRKKYHSLVGDTFFLEPGAIHDGHAPQEGGFTYKMLYLPPKWLEGELMKMSFSLPSLYELKFHSTLSHDLRLSEHIHNAFYAFHQQETKITQETALTNLLSELLQTENWVVEIASPTPMQAKRARDFIHEFAHTDIGLDDMASSIETDRFRLNRLFKQEYGLSPHAYLVQLRLSSARKQIAQGTPISEAATNWGFADQSHLGRWFKRAYRLSPAAYQRSCTNIPDSHS